MALRNHVENKYFYSENQPSVFVPLERISTTCTTNVGSVYHGRRWPWSSWLLGHSDSATASSTIESFALVQRFHTQSAAGLLSLLVQYCTMGDEHCAWHWQSRAEFSGWPRLCVVNSCAQLHGWKQRRSIKESTN